MCESESQLAQHQAVAVGFANERFGEGRRGDYFESKSGWRNLTDSAINLVAAVRTWLGVTWKCVETSRSDGRYRASFFGLTRYRDAFQAAAATRRRSKRSAFASDATEQTRAPARLASIRGLSADPLGKMNETANLPTEYSIL